MPEKDDTPKALTGLKLARPVLYVSPVDGAPRAAVIVGTGNGTGEDAVLLVFGLPNESLSYVPVAAFDSKKALGTWHWGE